MPIGWFIAPYARIPHPRLPVRGCVMDQHTAAIRADSGDWREVEILGNHAIVKVRASALTLASIALTPGITRIPKDLIDSSLSDLTQNQKNAITNKLESLGYPTAEWRARLGTNIGTKTLRDLLRFMATRRLKPRYDRVADTFVLDGPVQACESVDILDLVIR